MTFQLWRQDDNGYHFFVDVQATRERAEARMPELTRWQHNQTYWINPKVDTKQ